ncbi:hypothetical protein [Winogradskya humida]|nr:hypothetical protein [Actinoplanes humidus]
MIALVDLAATNDVLGIFTRISSRGPEDVMASVDDAYAAVPVLFYTHHLQRSVDRATQRVGRVIVSVDGACSTW